MGCSVGMTSVLSVEPGAVRQEYFLSDHLLFAGQGRRCSHPPVASIEAGPMVAPRMRSFSAATSAGGRADIPCMAATTEAEFAALQSVSAKSAAVNARFSVVLKIALPEPNADGDDPTIDHSIVGCGVLDTPAFIDGAKYFFRLPSPASAIEMTMSRHCR